MFLKSNSRYFNQTFLRQFISGFARWLISYCQQVKNQLGVRHFKPTYDMTKELQSKYYSRTYVYEAVTIEIIAKYNCYIRHHVTPVEHSYNLPLFSWRHFGDDTSFLLMRLVGERIMWYFSVKQRLHFLVPFLEGVVRSTIDQSKATYVACEFFNVQTCFESSVESRRLVEDTFAFVLNEFRCL